MSSRCKYVSASKNRCTTQKIKSCGLCLTHYRAYSNKNYKIVHDLNNVIEEYDEDLCLDWIKFIDIIDKKFVQTYESEETDDEYIINSLLQIMKKYNIDTKRCKNLLLKQQKRLLNLKNNPEPAECYISYPKRNFILQEEFFYKKNQHEKIIV